MISYLQLMLGTAGLSLLTFYIGWTKFRIFCIRQDLFQIRDELWDKARDLNCFEDEGYKAARDQLNSMIRIAHKVNLPVMAYVVGSPAIKENAPITSSCPQMQTAIEDAFIKTSQCITTYVVYYRPFSGLLLMNTVYTFYLAVKSAAGLSDAIASWLIGSGPRHFETLARR